MALKQSSTGITFNYEKYNNATFYPQIADLISQVGGYDETEPWGKVNIETTLDDIQDTYNLNRARYESIAQKTNIPPELIAAIHYREEADDYLAGTFGVYLHNGDPLGALTIRHPVGIYYDDFDEAAINALTAGARNDYYIENFAKQLELSSDSRDLTAMVTLSVLYNGWHDGGLSSYAFSGTDIYSGGLYQHNSTGGGTFNSNAKDKNLGIYLVLKKLLTR